VALQKLRKSGSQSDHTVTTERFGMLYYSSILSECKSKYHK